jgi:DNA polymerase-3 subunit epsilon
MNDSSPEEAVRILEAHSDYKVIRRILPRSIFAVPDGREIHRGMVVDTETTGLQTGKDAIIELGMVLFEYDPLTGQAYRILDVFGELEDPGFPIPSEATAIHGITDEMVHGKRIDDGRIAQMLDGVSVVIAHNAKFDRVFMEKRLPIFESAPWGCSWAQVDWNGEGLGSAKLDYIAYQYGMFFDAHRAQEDCLALLEILQKPLPKSGVLVLKSILDGVPKKSYKVFANRTPFEKKDILRQRGYKWDPGKKCWHNTLTGDALVKTQAEWLKAEIYVGRSASIDIEVQNCLTRYSDRPGNKISKTI